MDAYLPTLPVIIFGTLVALRWILWLLYCRWVVKTQPLNAAEIIGSVGTAYPFRGQRGVRDLSPPAVGAAPPRDEHPTAAAAQSSPSASTTASE